MELNALSKRSSRRIIGHRASNFSVVQGTLWALDILAQYGIERADWETSLNADSAIAEAWASQQTQVSNRSQARSSRSGHDTSSLVIPLVAGVRSVALVALEADRAGAYPSSVVDRIADLTTPAALRLEAALLFDDVRSLATNEER